MRPSTDRGSDLERDSDRWFRLGGEGLPTLSVPKSAYKDFKRRNARRASLRTFRPKELQIEWSEEVQTMNCLYSLTLPGYSWWGDEAIVEISCATWALAGGGELLYLRRVRGEWRVIAMQQTWIS
jgi:hypothetical protein